MDAECLAKALDGNESYNIYKADNTERCWLADGRAGDEVGERGHGCKRVRWFFAAMFGDAWSLGCAEWGEHTAGAGLGNAVVEWQNPARSGFSPQMFGVFRSPEPSWAFHRRSQDCVGKKIIGRTCTVRDLAIDIARSVGVVRGAFALGNEPARYGRRGVFFEPLVHQGADLFAEVGGVGESRQFVALQTVA